MMKNRAARLVDKGDLQIVEIPMPEPAPGEVLVRVEAVGVCGSDTHYFDHGSIGKFKLTAPMTLGHEPAGTVVDVGPGVAAARIGQPVSLEPGVPCDRCEQCRSGRYNLCPDMRFMATPPHDGAFARFITWRADFAHPLPLGMSMEQGALAEPLSVGIWAATRAGIKLGDRVLITGAGPVGLLATSVALRFGASEVVVRDPNPHRLSMAQARGATTESVPGKVEPEGRFDVLLECSGAPGVFGAALEELRPQGRAMMIGLPAEEPVLPLAALHHKELSITTNFRYANTWPKAIGMLADGSVPTDGIITHRFGIESVAEALLASRTQAGCVKAVVLPQLD